MKILSIFKKAPQAQEQEQEIVKVKAPESGIIVSSPDGIRRVRGTAVAWDTELVIGAYCCVGDDYITVGIDKDKEIKKISQLEDLIEGVEIDGVRYGSIDANLERRTGANVWVEMKLTEGKNREVRRVLEHLGLRVSRLIRTSYGPFDLGGLEKGQVAEVDRNDLFRFRKELDK